MLILMIQSILRNYPTILNSGSRPFSLFLFFLSFSFFLCFVLLYLYLFSFSIRPMTIEPPTMASPAPQRRRFVPSSNVSSTMKMSPILSPGNRKRKEIGEYWLGKTLGKGSSGTVRESSPFFCCLFALRLCMICTFFYVYM